MTSRVGGPHPLPLVSRVIRSWPSLAGHSTQLHFEVIHYSLTALTSLISTNLGKSLSPKETYGGQITKKILELGQQDGSDCKSVSHESVHDLSLIPRVLILPEWKDRKDCEKMSPDLLQCSGTHTQHTIIFKIT